MRNYWYYIGEYLLTCAVKTNTVYKYTHVYITLTNAITLSITERCLKSFYDCIDLLLFSKISHTFPTFHLQHLQIRGVKYVRFLFFQILSVVNYYEYTYIIILIRREFSWKNSSRNIFFLLISRRIRCWFR